MHLNHILILVLIDSFVSIYCLNSNEFQCKSNQKNTDFLNIERFTDNMCAQCFWYMADVSIAWKNPSKVLEWQFRYNYSESINVLLKMPDIRKNKTFNKVIPFKYSAFNRSDKDNDFILKEFKQDFHMVCYFKIMNTYVQ
jgi:hypothetical protein